MAPDDVSYSFNGEQRVATFRYVGSYVKVNECATHEVLLKDDDISSVDSWESSLFTIVIAHVRISPGCLDFFAFDVCSWISQFENSLLLNGKLILGRTQGHRQMDLKIWQSLSEPWELPSTPCGKLILRSEWIWEPVLQRSWDLSLQRTWRVGRT